MQYHLITKILGGLALSWTLIFTFPAHAAFWAQQQTQAEAVVEPSAKPSPKPVKPVAKALPKSISKPASTAHALTFAQVQRQDDSLKHMGKTAQRIQLWQHFAKAPKVDACHKLHATYTLANLYKDQEQYTTALNYFDNYLKTYAHIDCNIRDWITFDVLYDKAFVLLKLNRKVESTALYKQIGQAYQHSSDANIQYNIGVGYSNIVENAYILGDTAQVITYAKRAKKIVNNRDDTYAIMSFFLWLVNNQSDKQLLKAMQELTPDADYSWDWRDIKPSLTQLPTKRQAKANCVIEFFEYHHDTKRVKSCMAKY